MPGIQDFVQLAVKNLGTTEQTAQSATGGLLQMMQQQVKGQDFDELLGKIPGAEASGSGSLGGLLGSAASALGGKMGSAMNVAGMLKQSALELGKAGGFVSLFLGFLKDQGGAGLLDRILSRIPDLKSAAG